MKGVLAVLLFLTSLTMGCSFFDSSESEAHYTQIDCKLYDGFKLIAQFPGFFCAFSPNGEWLSLEEDTLTLNNRDNSPKYKFPDLVHHEAKFSNDGKRIYFLSSYITLYKNKKTRFDIINVSDHDGKLLYRWNTYDHIQEIIKTLKLEEYEPILPFGIPRSVRRARDEEFEFSHLNAIHEIAKNPLEDDLPYMKRGNLLVTFNGLGAIVIFDPELKNILHVFNKVLNVELFGFHDAQVLPNGHLLYFQNMTNRNGEFGTSVKEVDIKAEKDIWSYAFLKPKFKFNPINGSVQLLANDNIFIGDNSFGGRAVEIDRQGEILSILENTPHDLVSRRPNMIYRAKKVNADEFLKNNQLGMWARNQN